MAEEIVTDLGTLRLIGQLTARGRNELAGFLERCRRNAYVGATATTGIRGWMFERSDIEEMKLEFSRTAKIAKIVASTTFSNGSLWRRGSLRIKNVRLPDTIMIAIKGRTIGEVVEGAPFPDFRITHAVHDGSGDKLKLRIRCDGEATAPIVLKGAL